MSVPVALEALWERIAEFGVHPYLITVGGNSASHVVSVTVRLDDALVNLRVGNTTRENLAVHPSATLLWPALPKGDYSLIVDGTAERLEDDDELAIRPTRAVLHRVAGASDALPGCVPVIDR